MSKRMSPQNGRVTFPSWRSKGLCLATALLVALGPIAGAAEPGALEEIVVTARKISEPLQEVPLTITAFSAKQLEERGVRVLRTTRVDFLNARYELQNAMIDIERLRATPIVGDPL